MKMSRETTDGPTACLLVIGSEVLSGRTPDRNLNHLARRLAELGVDLREARVLPDDEGMIVAAVNETRARYHYVFTTGGIGPTHDDITADSIAKAFGVGVAHHPDAVALMRASYPPEMLNEARLRMARVPNGAVLIKNPVSHAPGFRIENVFVFAGVPAIMQAMFEEIAHELEGGPPAASVTVSCFLGEGAVADRLRTLQEEWRTAVEIGSYPFYRKHRYGTSIVFRSRDPSALGAAVARFRAIVRELGEEPVEGEVA